MSNSDNAAHLFCYGCRANPSLAKLDAGKAFVCHCTHVDGEISPVPYGNLDDKPERWKFVAPPERPVNNRKTLCAKTGCEKTTATGQIFCDKHLESGCSRTGRTNE